MNYNNDLNELYNEVQSLIEETKRKIYQTVNTEMILLYWNIGKNIMEMQEGKPRADYGKKLLEDISNKLTAKYGKGYSKRNLELMRQFYKCFPIANSVNSQLSWTHYKELIKIKNISERDFYMHECINARWDVRTLQRQRKSCLYERLLLTSDEEKEKLLPTKGDIIKTNKDLVKDPYILEFLDIKDTKNYSEKELEGNILLHLKEFMIELGKGFMFVGSQVRIKLNDDEFYVDLVFYNRLIKCHVLLDLKVGKITHKDIGQMNLYVNYYNKYVKVKDENPTIGILLGTTKNKVAVELTIPENNEVFASIYKLHFPTKEELINFIEKEIV